MQKKALLAGTGLAGVFLGYAAVCPVSQIWGRGFHRGPRGRRQLALTFDDGPSEWTPAVLEVLADYSVPASFFVCGKNVERLPGVAEQTLRAGHEIGNHTYSHPLLFGRRYPAVRAELEKTQAVIERVLRVRARLFRPPYGVRAPSLRRVQEELGLTSVMWTAIGHDWVLSAGGISRRILAGADDGAVICLHDGDRVREHADRKETVRALPRIIEGLLSQGYSFVTAGEMLDQLAGEVAAGGPVFGARRAAPLSDRAGGH